MHCERTWACVITEAQVLMRTEGLRVGGFFKTRLGQETIFAPKKHFFPLNKTL